MDGARESLVSLSGSERGGVIQGFTPIHSHVQLYLVQIILIVVMCFVLGQLVKKWHQPRVIAEVGWSVRTECYALLRAASRIWQAGDVASIPLLYVKEMHALLTVDRCYNVVRHFVYMQAALRL